MDLSSTSDITALVLAFPPRTEEEKYILLPYYRHILPYGLPKFKRFAIEVWKVDPEGKTDEEVAEEGLKAMEGWMKELGLAMNISEFGATKDMIDGIADATFLLESGYKVLKREEVVAILKESL